MTVSAKKTKTIERPKSTIYTRYSTSTKLTKDSIIYTKYTKLTGTHYERKAQKNRKKQD